MGVRLEVRGLREAQEEMERIPRDLGDGPMAEGMRQATLLVTRDAKRFAPVDTGRLRASITPEVRVQSRTVMGVVGSNVAYAPYVELGTRPHFVPARYIGKWAERHGFGYRGLIVSGRAIKYLERALTQNVSEIVRILDAAVARIVRGD